MATADATRSSAAGSAGDYREQGSGWVLFAGIMILTVGILNVIYGIAAIDNSTFFVADQKFIFSDLNTWGWVMLVLGALRTILGDLGDAGGDALVAAGEVYSG